MCQDTENRFSGQTFGGAETGPSVAKRRYSAILDQEGDGYVAFCPELDVASQGATVESALANLKEAVELLLESADESEIGRRRSAEMFVTQFEVGSG